MILIKVGWMSVVHDSSFHAGVRIALFVGSRMLGVFQQNPQNMQNMYIYIYLYTSKVNIYIMYVYIYHM